MSRIFAVLSIMVVGFTAAGYVATPVYFRQVTNVGMMSTNINTVVIQGQANFGGTTTVHISFQSDGGLQEDAAKHCRQLALLSMANPLKYVLTVSGELGVPLTATAEGTTASYLRNLNCSLKIGQ